MGIALKAQGKLDEAMAYFEQTLRLKPDNTQAHLNRSLVRLLRGGL